MTPKILYIDDSADDRMLAKRAIEERLVDVAFEALSDLKQVAERLEGVAPDLVVSDYRLRWSDGFAMLDKVKARWPGVPFILFTGTGTEEVAVEALKRGAADYVVKNRVGYDRLAEAVAAALLRAMEVAARRAAEQRLATLFEELPIALIEGDPEGWITAANPAADRLFGFTDGESMAGRGAAAFFANPAELRSEIETLLERGRVAGKQLMLRRRDGSTFWVEHYTSAEKKPSGETVLRAALIDITDRKAREEQEARARTLEARYADLLEELAVAIVETTPDGRILFANHAWRNLFGYAPDADLSAVGARSCYADPGDRDRWQVSLGSPQTLHTPNIRFRRRDGTTFWGEIHARLTSAGSAGPTWRGLVFDTTMQRQLEEQLLQAQKLESIGRLTGGIAHDFNNLLTVIVGSAEMLEAPLAGTRHARSVKLIGEAAHRAAALTHRLLAFARRQMLIPKVLDPKALVEGLVPLLQRTMGPDFEVATDLAASVWPIRVDNGQLESALVNLAVNARDAMPNGGKLTISVANLHLPAGVPEVQGCVPGDYVAIAVRDTGEGIAPEIVERVFEPFFTTKAIGVGTGLGLSQVHGFVTQSQGHVTIASELGRGTEVKLYFPRHAPSGVEGPEAAVSPLPRGGETVLLIDDDELVREILRNQIAGLGYQVREAGDATGAMAALAEGGIDLVVCDIMLGRGMTGDRLVAEARAARPGLPALFISGYQDPGIAARIKGEVFLAKPFTVHDLALKLREVLGRR